MDLWELFGSLLLLGCLLDCCYWSLLLIALSWLFIIVAFVIY